MMPTLIRLRHVDDSVARARSVCAMLMCTASLLYAPPTHAQSDHPTYLDDRGDGIPTSLVGTYVRKGELLVYPFYEYTVNRDQEYKPSELGFGVEHDYRARRTDHEQLLFLSYGWTDRVAIEMESALFATATQNKSPLDPSAMPSRLHESGFGDTQAEVRWRWARETARRPEVFSYFEVVFPFQRNRKLIGTSDWEVNQSLGLIKGSRWGTFTGRVSASYNGADRSVSFGEWDLEYLKRTSPRWRWALSLEGEQDEVALMAEAQLRLTSRAFLKLDNGFGLTRKAPDQAPEVGVVFSF